MAEISWYISLGILLIITVLSFVRDPRRFRCAILFGTVVFYSVMVAIGALNGWMYNAVGDAFPITLLAQLGIVLVAAVVMGILLVDAGIKLLLREGFSLSHGLSLALGVGILAYVVASVLSVRFDSEQLVVLLLLLGLPIFFMAFLLMSFLMYIAVYAAWARRHSARADVVVVLGSGLQGKRVTPLLAARLDLGIATYRECGVRNPQAVMVVSGGKGPGEDVTEAEAMAGYVRARGITDVLLEDRSTTTEENLRFSSAVVNTDGLRWTAVTSDFHAFRAALLLRKEGLRGNAIGARTPWYFWSSAILREFVAILSAHLKVTLAALVILSVPFFALLPATILR